MFGNLLRLMKDNKALDRLILVSGTFHNNKCNFENLPLDPDIDVIEPEKNTAEVLMEILAEEGREYDLYHERIKMWNLLQKMMKSKIAIEDIDPFLLMEFGNDFEKPTHKYGGKNHV